MGFSYKWAFEKSWLVVALFLMINYSCSNDDSEQDRCTLNPDPGLCNAYFVKYYFNNETKKCEEFVWGGCGGVIPFDTMEECLACETSDKK